MLLLVGCGNHSSVSHYSGLTDSNRRSSRMVASNGARDSWRPEVSGATTSINSVQFVSAADGWAVGGNGAVFRTLDGGKSWNEHQVLSDNVILNGVHFVSRKKGWAVGDIIKSNSGIDVPSMDTMPVIMKTVDGGKQWSLQREGKLDSLVMGCSTNQQHTLFGIIVSGLRAFAIGSEIYASNNGGRDWHVLNLPMRIALSRAVRYQYDYCGFRSGYFVNGNDVWLVGSAREGGTAEVGLIVGSSDGGRYWSVEESASFMRPLNDVFFVNASDGWAVGQDGEIFFTNNGGKGWRMQLSGVLDQLNSVFFLSPSQGWVVGNSGVILATTDGGRHWFRENSGTRANLHSVYCVPSGCWAVGSHGTILHLRLGHG